MSDQSGLSENNQAEREHKYGRKLFAFLYGSTVYLAVWFIHFYIVGFVGNYFGPLINTEWGDVLPLKSIDMGVEEPFITAFIVNLLLIGLLGFQHSFMPRKVFKTFITKHIPAELERSTYVIFAIAALSILMWQWRPITDVVWHIENIYVAVLLHAISLAGWLTVLVATFQVGHWKVFGIAQVLDHIMDKPYTFDKPGHPSVKFFKVGWPISDKKLWRHSRHPEFFGFIVAFWSTPYMTVGHLMFALGLTCYIMIGVFLLERNLRETYGREYELYLIGRSKIIPWVAPKKPALGSDKTIPVANKEGE